LGSDRGIFEVLYLYLERVSSCKKNKIKTSVDILCPVRDSNPITRQKSFSWGQLEQYVAQGHCSYMLQCPVCLSSHNLQKYLNFNIQHSFVEYAIKIVGFGEEGDKKITEFWGTRSTGRREKLHNGERLIVTAYVTLLSC